MTTNELVKHLNDSLDQEWPKTFKVDAETYANCCQAIFNNKIDNIDEDDNKTFDYKNYYFIEIILGRNRGLMFKNIELILDKLQ